MEDRAIPNGFFDVGAFDSDRPMAGRSLLFPAPTPWLFALESPGGEGASAELRGDQIGAAADFLRLAIRTDDVATIRDVGAFLGDAVLETLIAERPAPPSSAWPAISGPGIYRREHACLAIASPTTVVVLDPIRLSISEDVPALSGRPADAVLITHQHTDHWHLPSILEVCSTPTTPVIVPHTRVPNLLCPERFEESLAFVGQRAVVADWGSTVTVGDIEIDILPFFGEQPTQRGKGAPPGVRSYGNCFRFNTPTFSALVLVDSGADPGGNMLDVIARSEAKRGPVDVVLSCLRTFACPFFGGLPTYWPTLSFRHLAELWRSYEDGNLPPTTAGAAGVAAACRVAKAKHFLPYAHGYAGVGEPIRDVGWGTGEPSEHHLLKQVVAELRGAETLVHPWNPGDSAHVAGSWMSFQHSRPTY